MPGSLSSPKRSRNSKLAVMLTLIAAIAIFAAIISTRFDSGGQFAMQARTYGVIQVASDTHCVSLTQHDGAVYLDLSQLAPSQRENIASRTGQVVRLGGGFVDDRPPGDCETVDGQQTFVVTAVDP